MLTPTELKALLAAHGLRLSKRLGQHHLVNARVIERIVDQCELSADDTVVEIGAGLGALTEPLARRAGRVIAVEVDRRICELLRNRMRTLPSVSVVCQDILEFAWERVAPAVVIGAIPYSVTSPILALLCEQRHAVRRAILVIQREVAQRLVARPATKAYGRLSLLCQYGWQITPVLDVPRSAFFPQPEVDSTCLKLLPRPSPAVAVDDEEALFGFIKAAFAHRRKSLVNCLCNQHDAGGPSRADVAQILHQMGMPASVRGETLSLEQFALLSNVLKKR